MLHVVVNVILQHRAWWFRLLLSHDFTGLRSLVSILFPNYRMYLHFQIFLYFCKLELFPYSNSLTTPPLPHSPWDSSLLFIQTFDVKIILWLQGFLLLLKVACQRLSTFAWNLMHRASSAIWTVSKWILIANAINFYEYYKEWFPADVNPWYTEVRLRNLAVVEIVSRSINISRIIKKELFHWPLRTGLVVMDLPYKSPSGRGENSRDSLKETKHL